MDRKAKTKLVKCHSCNKIFEIGITTGNLKDIPKGYFIKYTCGACNAELAAKNISNIWDNVFKK